MPTDRDAQKQGTSVQHLHQDRVMFFGHRSFSRLAPLWWTSLVADNPVWAIHKKGKAGMLVACSCSVVWQHRYADHSCNV